MELFNNIYWYISHTKPLYLLSLPVTILLVLLPVFYKIYKCSRKNLETNFVEIAGNIEKECAYPNCIRCKRRLEIIDKAKRLFKTLTKNMSWVPKRHEEIYKQLKKLKYKYNYDLQKPNVFYLPQIKAQPFWETIDNSGCGKTVFKNITAEYHQIKTCDNGWKENETPNGKWHIFHLIDQGVVTENATLCPVTMKFLLSKANLMHETVFANAAFSVIQPHTHIPAHYGPTNIRLRCHLGLDIPKDAFLTVGFKKQTLKTNVIKCITFDDSFLHSAQNDGKEDRVVLLYDIWHPEIQPDTKVLLSEIFSPLL